LKLSTVKRQFIDGPYGQVHLRSSGDQQSQKPALMCLHMCPKSSLEFESLLQQMGDSRFVVAADYPGYGESALPPADPHVTLNDYAESMWYVADALGLETFDLLGSHTGSMVAAAMGRQRPAEIRRIIMVSAVVLTNKEAAQYMELFQPVPLDEEGTRFRYLWQMFMQHRGPGVTLEMAAESMAEALRGGDAYEWGHRAAFSGVERFVEHICSLNQTVTLINPADGLEEPTRRALPLLKNGRIIEKPEWGFGFLSTETTAARELIESILDENHDA
jgi:pimeloyl-ACP methyl ester carboxylesterase